ncbi:rhodopsin-like [Paramacrobiotus metropolitanus]|uniref:rhodopsin-like n=1 Tax=Paramacrobiotus metropolitanus TaxID=2943436 RepID=UPI002445B35A|nr:rhodopsin-like [Paramacrobiotus metropolitanus]XP_055350441.1 rhodopsin-like [Paramacrobiotus metropolitanus]
MEDLTITDPTTNLTLTFSPSDVAYISPSSLSVWLAFCTALCTFGTLSYLILLAILFRRHNGCKGAGGLLMVHLVILELINSLGYLSFFTVTTYVAQSGVRLNHTACAIGQLLFLSTVVAGNWVAVVMAVNRFVAIVFPLWYKVWLDSPLWSWAVGLCWFIAFACYVPIFMGIGGVLAAIPPLGTCGVYPFPGWRYHFSVQFGTPVPMFLIGIFYGLIYLKMVVKVAERRTSQASVINFSRRESTIERLLMVRYRTAKMLCISAIWHCLCFVPLPIMVEYAPIFYRDPLVHLWIRTIFFCGYAFNPVILFIMNERYRQCLMEKLWCFGTVSKGNQDDPDSHKPITAL